MAGLAYELLAHAECEIGSYGRLVDVSEMPDVENKTRRYLAMYIGGGLLVVILIVLLLLVLL